MRNFLSILVIAAICFAGCKEKNDNPKNLQNVWLDSIIRKADSSYTRDYYRTDFVKAFYYVNSKDSTTTQLMKDSAGRTRQVIIMRGSKRIFYAQYFANGNVQADLALDESGQYHGTGIFYHENGKVQSIGNFDHGIKTGKWKVFDENGKQLSEHSFDKDGQLIQQPHP